MPPWIDISEPEDVAELRSLMPYWMSMTWSNDRR